MAKKKDFKQIDMNFSKAIENKKIVPIIECVSLDQIMIDENIKRLTKLSYEIKFMSEGGLFNPNTKIDEI